MTGKNQVLMVLLSLFIIFGFISLSLVEAKSKEEVYQEKLAQVKEGDLRGYFDLGLWCQQNKLDAQAKEMFEKIIALNPDHFGARDKLGYVKYKNQWIKKDEIAKVDYEEKLTKLKDDDTKGFYELGLWCQQNKLETQAKEMFERVIALDPEHTGAREKLGYIKYKNKWIKKGEETKADYEEKLAKLKDDDVEGHYGLGCWCKEKKLFYEARDEFEKAVKLDANHQKAQKELELITQQLSPTGFLKRPMDNYKTHYCANVPKQYDSKKKWPLIIGLHGTGGTGDMFLRRRWEQISNEKGYLVIAPRSPGNNWDIKDEDFVMACLDDFKKDYQIDTSRIYLTGFSGGASMALLFGMNNFQKFAALAMVGGGEQTGPISPNTVVLPLYFLVGEKDQSTKGVVKPVTEQLEQQGFSVKYEEMPNIGLDWPDDTSSKIINWFESLLSAEK
ncbi:MAG: hypothetical protein V1871_05430 [Planctomycetota bacterium]